MEKPAVVLRLWWRETQTADIPRTISVGKEELADESSKSAFSQSLNNYSSLLFRDIAKIDCRCRREGAANKPCSAASH